MFHLPTVGKEHALGSPWVPLPVAGVCVYYCRTYYKAVRGGGRRRVEDMCYERRRAEACVDESAHHALANAGTSHGG